MGSRLERFLGGSPGSVAVKLVFVSLLVGAFMSLLGLTPPDLFERVVDLALALRDFGFETFGTVGRWLLYGAMVVVPVWFVLRLLQGLR